MHYSLAHDPFVLDAFRSDGSTFELGAEFSLHARHFYGIYSVYCTYIGNAANICVVCLFFSSIDNRWLVHDVGPVNATPSRTVHHQRKIDDKILI